MKIIILRSAQYKGLYYPEMLTPLELRCIICIMIKSTIYLKSGLRDFLSNFIYKSKWAFLGRQSKQMNELQI